MRSTEKPGCFMTQRFYANDAIKEALVDLGKCYKAVLSYGCDKMKDMPDKTIAIAPLGTEVGVPREKAAPIVVKAVFEFIQAGKKNPSYSKIVLLVRKSSELAEYKSLISKELDTQNLVAC
jgi:O-acetyl-ADP-ribose deacetylase (regulator of RNase III)